MYHNTKPGGCTSMCISDSQSAKLHGARFTWRDWFDVKHSSYDDFQDGYKSGAASLHQILCESLTDFCGNLTRD